MSELLIVDDEEVIRDLLTHYLSGSFDCTTASGADKAKELLAAGSFRVVLTDIRMPGASGFELLAHIKKEHPSVVVVMMSSELESAADAKQQGAFDFIPKPFDLVQVRDVIERALKH